MTNEEANKVLEELHEVRPEKLNDRAKRLFEAIMKIADGRDKAESDLYEANNRINDLLDIVKQKEKMIDLMVDEIYRVDWQSECGNSREAIKKYIEERCK